MNYLQLAESPEPVMDPRELYVEMPTVTGTSVFVREDVFDNLPEPAYQGLMAILEQMPRNYEGMAGKAERQARREARQAKKQANKDRRAETIKSVAGTVGNVAKSIFGKGGDDSGAGANLKGLNVTGGVDFGTQPQKAWYQRPEVMIPTAIGAAALVYYATKKKRK